MTRVKICGVCRPQDALLATSHGADYIGVILAPGFSRSQSPEHAAAIFDAAADAARVGVFVNATSYEIVTAAERLGLDVVQLHGDERPEVVYGLRGHGFEVWKAVRVREASAVRSAAGLYEDADALLLDGWSPRAQGGTGTRFDWHAVAALRSDLPASLRLVVAGGLDAETVGDVVRILDPDVVDVSSGVEEAIGRKSAARVQAFIAAAGGAGDSRE